MRKGVGVGVSGNKPRSAGKSGRVKKDCSKCNGSYPGASTSNVIRSVSWKKTESKE
jgi:hypothetical protein